MIKWRNRIEIKGLLGSDDSDMEVLKVVSKLIPQLKRIATGEHKMMERMREGIYKENIDDATYNLENLIEEFEWIKTGIETKEDISDLPYENWCDAFNNYFEELYDLADTVVKYIDSSNKEKFLWVG